MKTKASYLVIDTYRSRATIVRVTQSWPTLGAGEIAVRLALEIPDTTHPEYQVIVHDDEAMVEAITVPADPPAEDQEE